MQTNPFAEASRHKCLIYDGQASEQLPVVVPFLASGLQSNWRCLYLGSPDMVRMVDSALIESGVDTRRETARGRLVLSSDRSHLRNGHFDPRGMIDILCAFIDSAVRDGYEGLCATGDMKWELGKEENFDRLLEYEARLEQLFREKPLRGICQYHRNLIPAECVPEVFATHSSVYIGDVLNRDNLFYVPPEVLLESHGGASRSTRGEWMSRQILRILKAEEKRDEALEALRRSESRQRLLAAELAEMNANLERRIQERTAELEAANRHLEAFSYSVSHDLRAPLQAIMGFSEILAGQFGAALPEKARSHLQRISSSGRQMASLIDGLLSLSGVLKADLNRVPVDLSGLAEEIIGELRESQPARSAEFVAHSRMRVLADPILIRSLLSNLLGNAWKFSSKRPHARIEFGQMPGEAGETVFFVKDNGAGFEMQQAGRIFTAFHRLHEQREFPGTGIGLATAQRIIAKHGGRIWAEGRANWGATFFFTIPAGESLQFKPAAPPAADSEPIVRPSPRKDETGRSRSAPASARSSPRS